MKYRGKTNSVKKGLALLMTVCMITGMLPETIVSATENTKSAWQTEAVTEESETESSQIVENTETQSTKESSEASVTNEKTDEEANTEKSDIEESDIKETDTKETDSEEINTKETISEETESDTKENNSKEIYTEETDNEETESDTEENSSEEETIEEETADNVSVLEENVNAETDNSEITRVEWLQALTTTFNMTVDEANYPDNYYSDIDSSSEYYYDVMLATEFGLIDVEAGEALCPEDAATREFAAHTLNLCLGYSLEEESYTYTEADDVIYPQDIQIAIDKGWFTLSDGAFLPDNAVTESEKDAMLEYAETELAKEAVDLEHNNQYEFVEDVVVLSEDIEVEATGTNQITIKNCSEELSKGDKFAIVADNLPVVFKVSDITTDGENTIIATENVATNEAFESIDLEGRMQGELTEIEPINDEVELNYIVGGSAEKEWEDGVCYDTLEEVGSQQISAVEAVQTWDVPKSVQEDFKLSEGVKLTISCKFSDVHTDYHVDFTSAYVDINTIATFSCNLSIDVMEAMGIAPSISLIKVPLGPFGLLGYMEATLDLTFKGEMTASLVEYISAGVYYDIFSGFRTVHHFRKESFTIQSHVEVSAGITFMAKLGWILSGSIYGKVGVKATVDSITYNDDKLPLTCSHVYAWLYAGIGYDVSVDLGPLYKESWGDYKELYSLKNSPVRVSYHYEDGCTVPRCTREQEEDGSGSGTSSKRWKYYTPADSKYGYNGASSGTGSNGETYTIFEYTLNDERKATITKYNGNVSALNIPSTLDGYEVIAIGDSVFKNNTRLRIVVIPDSVTSIGQSAFEGCSNISSLTLSNGVESIEYYAFKNCDGLTSVEIPKSLNNSNCDMDYYNGTSGVFAQCDNLKNVTFEEGTTEITKYLFANCIGLEKIEIPNTVTVIEKCAFYNCNNLKEISISDSVTSIGQSAFYNCTAFEKIIIPDSVTSIGQSAFENCSELKQLELSKKVTYIEYYAFKNCDGLTSVEIPKSLNNSNCDMDYYNGTSGVFAQCDNLKNVTFEEGTTEITKYLFANCTGLEKIEIPNTVTVIEKCAFYNCYNLNEVRISDSVTKIQTYAFYNCTTLEKIIIPHSVTNIGQSAFENCSELKQLDLSKKVTYIEYYAFKNCDGLTSVEIPKSLNNSNCYLDYYNGTSGVFADCDNLKNITFEEGTTKIIKYLFSNCNGLEKIEIPNTVTVIEEYAFYNCKNLKEALIPEGVTQIQNNAFYNCISLEEITIPNSVTGIGTYTFTGCSSLKKATLPNTRVNIPEGIFRYCTSLETVEIPETVNYIRKYAFQNTAITKLTIPNNVVSIEDAAFRDCTALAEVTFGEKLTSIGNSAFYNCDSLVKAELPDSVTFLDSYAFADCELLSDLKLSTGLTKLPSYAFNLCPKLNKVVLPYRMATVENNVFTNCTSLTEVTIPRATTSIGSNTFSYPSKMTIYGISGTYAETYANEIGATFVNQEIKATEVKLSAEELTVNKGAKANLILTVTPDNFTDAVTWRCTDEEIATVTDAGVVTAKKLGTATIKVTVGDVSATCKVTVVQPVTSIRLNKTSVSMEALQTCELTASVYPSDAQNKDIEWTTSDEKVATVDANGKVTAITKGQAVITATAKDGSGVKADCTVTVTSNGYICDDISQLESPHNYPLNCNDSWSYTKSGVQQLKVTFDAQTEVEEDFDFIYIYDAEDKQIGKYTGKELAGITITITGDTVKIKLVSDEAGTAWGFKVTDISSDDTEESETETETETEESDESETSTEDSTEDSTEEPTEPETPNDPEDDEDEKEDTLPEDMPEDGIPKGLWIAGIKEYYTYTGKAIKPEVRVYDGSHKLTSGVDYTISYKNNINASTYAYGSKVPMIIVNGKGDYKGKETATFNINPINLESADIITEDIVAAYNGKAQKKAPVVTYQGKKLKNKKDYTLYYLGNCIEVGTYDVVLTAVEGGNFTGTRTIKLTITDSTLITKASIAKIPAQTYQNGEEIKPELTVKYKGELLVKDTDYTLAYQNNREAGTATAIITGIGKFAGTKKVNFKINGTPLKKAAVTGIYDKVYNGTKQVQKVQISLNGALLVEGKDYRIVYSNNKNAGKASITITGINGFTGSIKKTFKILPYDIQQDAEGLIEGLSREITAKYVKGGAKPDIQLTFNKVKLKEGKDYTISYKNNKSVTTKALMTVKGKGNYKGTLKKSFTITAKALDDAQSPVTMLVPDVGFVNKAGKYISKPILTDADGKKLVAGKDYEKDIYYTTEDGTKLNNSDIVNVNTNIVVTVMGKGAYTGTLKATYRVTAKEFKKAKINISPQVYTGKEIYVEADDIKVTVNGETLTFGVDYEVLEGSYINNINKGTATVTIVGKGSYGGMKTVKFKIVPKQMMWFY